MYIRKGSPEGEFGMWKNEEKILTDDELCRFVESNPKSVIVLTGSTMCGKTSLLKSVKTNRKLRVSAELFSEVVYTINKNKNYDLTDCLLSSFGDCELLCIEDLDMFMASYNVLCWASDNFIREVLKNTTIVFTGVDIDKWQIFSELSRVFEVLFIKYYDGTDEDRCRFKVFTYNTVYDD